MYGTIKRLCREQGITISQMEQILGFGRNTMNRWDRKIPSVDKVKRVADELGVSIETLIN